LFGLLDIKEQEEEKGNERIDKESIGHLEKNVFFIWK